MRVQEQQVPWYVADFETTSYRYYEEYGYTKVWLYSIANRNADIVTDGDNIDDFMEWCEGHPSCLVYFHNLRFDGTFIISWLLHNDYPWVEKTTKHSKKSFTTLIGDMGEYYQIKINFAPNKQIVIQDSLKIIPLKVKEIAKAFKLPIEKGKIDYDDYTIDDKKLSYVHRDVQIVAMALAFFREQGFYRMTIGSNAYHQFTDETLNMKAMFPRLDIEWLNEWREAYRGGRSQVNPQYANQIVHNVHRFDINSMYPYVMSYKPMPYGHPIESDYVGRFEFEIYKVEISFTLKHGHLPTLLKTSSLYNKVGDTYYTNTDGIEILYLTSPDYQLLLRHYDIHYIKFVKIYGFKTSKTIFRDWIAKYYKLKSESEGGLRLVYKLIINNLYGKFGSKPKGRNKIPTLNDDGSIKYVLSEEVEHGIYYLPVALAVVSWAHVLIDDAIMKTGYDNFIYCDTDSVHTIGMLPQDWIDDSEIGKFKLEATEITAKYIRQKTYIHKDNGKNEWDICCAGMPDSIKDYLNREYKDKVIDIFKVGLTITNESPNITFDDMRLRPKQVNGGTVLQPIPFSIR